MIFRTLHFLGLALLCVFVTPLIFVPLVFFYSLRYFALELIPLAFLIDIYFGGGATLPLYTIGAFLLIVSLEISKHYLMLK